jgi:GlpG protein
MAWLWLLGKQIEGRLGKGKMVLFILITGVLANTAQYLMGGPDFLGFSGVIVGMVGFIWMRQKCAPWEGYPLQRSTILFIMVFVGAMLLLEVLAMTLEYFQVIQLSGGIANTAHIVGGVVGALLGRLRFFARSAK